MPRAILIRADHSRIEIVLPVGGRLVQAALAADIAEIAAQCGGSGICGTCHVIVDPAFWKLLPAASPAEEEILACVAAELEPTSRLACQIAMTDALDGLVVRLPNRQV